jgi:signal peptidase II
MAFAALRLLRRPAIWFWLAAATVVAADQGTKVAVASSLQPGESMRVIPSLLSLSLRRNQGAAFGILARFGLLLVFVAVAVIALLSVYGPRAAAVSRPLGVGVACELGGALGNVIDRALRGQVIDFIDVHIWPVFNVADAAIVVGAVLIGYFVVREDSSDREDANGSDDVLARIAAPRSPLPEETADR